MDNHTYVDVAFPPGQIHKGDHCHNNGIRQGENKWYTANKVAFNNGVHFPYRDILGNRKPRKYSSSTTGPAIPLNRVPRIAVTNITD